MKNKSGSSRTRTRLNGFSVRRIHHVCQRSIIILNTQLFYLRSIKAPQFEEVTPDLSLFCLCYADKTLHHRPTNSSYQQLSTCVCAIGGIEPPYLECIIVVLSREFIIYDAKRTEPTTQLQLPIYALNRHFSGSGRIRTYSAQRQRCYRPSHLSNCDALPNSGLKVPGTSAQPPLCFEKTKKTKNFKLNVCCYTKCSN